MKNAITCFLFATLSCAAQEVVKFSGKIINPNSDKITLKGEGFVKDIPVAKDGAFSATFDAAEAVYQFYDGNEYAKLYLKSGYDLFMTADTAQFDETIAFTGKGAPENNVLAQIALEQEKLMPEIEAVRNDRDPMKLAAIMRKYTNARESRMTAPGIDPGLKKAFDAKMKADVAASAEKRNAAAKAKEEALEKYSGKAAPDFNFENHKGGTTKLSDLKGKYVYIDTWATWCGPCRAEIPSLQKVEEKFSGKNIEFVSISVDVKKDYEKWRKFVTDKNLGGIQLIADNDWNSEFIRSFAIQSIPRFILIAPDGSVLDADAKRPSDSALTKQLEKLLK